ncbi:MAG TPA: glycosyltransferase family 4 protein [Candidatus Eisenbacteria bacterium]|jgi:glycosyltransferase involved in cell wall biosynthesis|nr:glycosyltransferase family 4 protein [Candidatus Eisenbacteria bacterium]
MRIAYICADAGVPVFGRKGCSIHVQEIIRAFRGQGAAVKLFASRFDGNAPLDLQPVSIHPLPLLPKGGLAARERAGVAANAGLQTALEREGPFDLIYERYSLWSFAGMHYARLAGIPGFLEVNAPLIAEQAEHRGLVDRAGAERVAEKVFADATALVAVSTEIKTYLENFPSARGRIHTIPNGVNPNRFRGGLRPARFASMDEFTVGFVGTLKSWHGLMTLAEAFAVLRRNDAGLRLLLVGDGPERDTFVNRVAELGVSEAVRLTGTVDPEEIPGLLASMDVAVAPYPRLPQFYFSPIKVYEYMAAGLPVIASRIGQLEELIEHGVTGWLVPPGDAPALAAALKDVRYAPVSVRERVGAAARSQVLKHHTWDAAARRIIGLVGFPERQPLLSKVEELN